MEIAFRDTAGELGRQIREAALDHPAFSMRLKICELTTCRATCCHDGVFLEAAERELIRGLIESKRDELREGGWIAEDLFEVREGRGKALTIPAAPGDLAESFPDHFPATRCVFLDWKHHCVLQTLGMEAKRHPWFWKPVSCWMHPLVLIPGQRGGRPCLTLATPGKDPAAVPDYPGFSSCTPCGMEADGGEPAWKALRDELDLLGRLGGRDLLGELAD